MADMTWQERVAEERAELTERLVKLTAAMGGDLALNIDETAYVLLLRQAELMSEYQKVLTMRLRTENPPD